MDNESRGRVGCINRKWHIHRALPSPLYPTSRGASRGRPEERKKKKLGTSSQTRIPSVTHPNRKVDERARITRCDECDAMTARDRVRRSMAVGTRSTPTRCTTGRRARQASDATVNQPTRENEEVRDKERSVDAGTNNALRDHAWPRRDIRIFAPFSRTSTPATRETLF